MSRRCSWIFVIAAVLAAGFAAPTAAKDFCPARIVSPSDGGTTSTTPTIQAKADPGGGCEPNAKWISLVIIHDASNNTVYEYNHVRGKGLLTGRAWKRGMLLVDHTVPEGELKAGETYRLDVDFPSKQVFPATFDTDVGFDGITFSTRGGSTSSAALSGDGAASMTLEANTDRPGADYRNFDIGKDDPTLCASACAYDPDCKAYTFAPMGYWEGSNAQCWLKDTIPERRSAGGLVSGVRWPDYTGAADPVTREANTDRPGADFKRLDLSSEDPQQCARVCARNQRCEAYTYTPRGHWSGSPPHCFLKERAPGRTQASGVFSGVRLE